MHTDECFYGLVDLHSIDSFNVQKLQNIISTLVSMFNYDLCIQGIAIDANAGIYEGLKNLALI